MPKVAKKKVCTECGKSEGPYWSRHWKNHHPNKSVIELESEMQPLNSNDENFIHLLNYDLQKIYQEAGINRLSCHLNRLKLNRLNLRACITNTQDTPTHQRISSLIM
jgi:hypothetical protein